MHHQNIVMFYYVYTGLPSVSRRKTKQKKKEERKKKNMLIEILVRLEEKKREQTNDRKRLSQLIEEDYCLWVECCR
jgi:hypothetical protein